MYLKFLDVCYPDYFQGFNGQTLAVPVYSTMRNHEALAALHSEINAWSGYMYKSQATESDFESLHNSANELFAEWDLRRSFCKDAGDESYAYFGICTE